MVTGSIWKRSEILQGGKRFDLRRKGTKIRRGRKIFGENVKSRPPPSCHVSGRSPCLLEEESLRGFSAGLPQRPPGLAPPWQDKMKKIVKKKDDHLKEIGLLGVFLLFCNSLSGSCQNLRFFVIGCRHWLGLCLLCQHADHSLEKNVIHNVLPQRNRVTSVFVFLIIRS